MTFHRCKQTRERQHRQEIGNLFVVEAEKMADSLFLYLNNRCTVFFFIAASNKQETTGVG